uniref:Uncharacterized protein n=1 Tax=Rhizophora mucronata TaxID=61149 RepID=A0A2P2P6Z4_RHIMU
MPCPVTYFNICFKLKITRPDGRGEFSLGGIAKHRSRVL